MKVQFRSTIRISDAQTINSDEEDGRFKRSRCWGAGLGCRNRRAFLIINGRRVSLTHLHTAKDLALAGVKSVTVYDPEPVTIQDLSTQVSVPRHTRVSRSIANTNEQFFLREGDVGKSRAEACVPRLAELNAYVPVRNLGGQPGQEITIDLISGFQACIGDSSKRS